MTPFMTGERQRHLVLQKRILRRLKKASENGMKRSELYRSLGSPITKSKMNAALLSLAKRNLAVARFVFTGTRGRPSEVWWLSTEIPAEYV